MPLTVEVALWQGSAVSREAALGVVSYVAHKMASEDSPMIGMAMLTGTIEELPVTAGSSV